jgi:signal transduction histidine kinase
MMIDTGYDPQLFSEFFDWQPQSFVWMQPIWNDAADTIVDFLYVYCNRVGLDYLKLTKDMLHKITIANSPSLTDEMRPAILDQMVKVYTTGETISIDLHNPLLNTFGRVFRIKFRGGVLTTIGDKTAEKNAIQELSDRTKELQRSNANLEDFAYAASHDLQEPLRKITAFSDKLKSELGDQLTTTQQNIFDRLQSAAVRMKGLIEDLLAYSRLNIKHENVKPINLTTLVEEVIQDLDGAISEAAISITINNLPEIEGDERQFRQLFQNLISNSIKYRNKQVPSRITVHGKRLTKTDPLLADFPKLSKEAYHLIEVRDNGIGFEQQYAERIFQVFQRLHSRAEYEGSGIGLAIVQKVVMNHNGFVRAIGSPGNGAVFQVLLPAK